MRSRLRMFRWVIWSGSVIGSGCECSGDAWLSVRCGRWLLWRSSDSRRVWRRWCWFQMSVRLSSSRAGAYPAFHDRVHSVHADTGEHNFDPRVREDRVEQVGILAVPVPDQESRAVTDVLQIHDKVPRGLCDSGGGGMRGGAKDPVGAGNCVTPMRPACIRG